jgi:O-antigen/teichoic acid export membrane protein
MKKSSFIQGAIVATLAIFITKILGIIFVIPFYAIVGEKGGALYSYAYIIYNVFLTLSLIGIPLAISKLTSEYGTLGDYHLKERAFKIAKILLFVLGALGFAIMVVFAPDIARLFIGDIKGGNTVSDIAFTIRIVAIALLIVPVASVTRGYLQGHKYITPSAISQVIEQVVRVIFILVGSFVCLNIFHMSLKIAVGIAVFAATIGAIASYIYLLFKIRKHKKLLRQDAEIKREEVHVTNKEIIKKILTYSIPFLMIALVTSFYNFIDMATIIKTMVKGLSYNVSEAENVASMISNWTTKIEMIVIAVGTGLTTSLIPTITNSYTSKNFEDVRNKVNKSLQLLLYAAIPMAIGLSLLASPVWTFFYGYSNLGNMVFGYNVFTTVFSVIAINLCIILQTVHENKKMILCMMIGLITKLILNVPLMYTFHSYGLHASYGPTTATIIGFLVTLLMALFILKKRLNINYELTFKRLIDILFSSFVMAIIIVIIQMFIPVNTSSRWIALLLMFAYTIIGGLIYITITIKNGLLIGIFGNNIFDKLLLKLKIKKVKDD